MDLTGLSRDDVAEVIGRLELAQAAADVLAEAGLEPVIDLSDDGLMLSASWVPAVSSDDGTEPGWPVVIEDAVGAWDGAPPPAAAEGDFSAGKIERAPPLITDADVIDLHLLSISRRGDWHMGADLALLRALLDHPHLDDRGIAKLVGRDVDSVAARVGILTDRALYCPRALSARLEALVAAAMGEDTGVPAEALTGPAGDTAAEAPPPAEVLGGEGGELQRHHLAEDDPLPAGGEVPPTGDPAEDAARGAFPDGAQDLSASQPGMTGPVARGDGSPDQSPEPAPAAGESGGAAAEDPDLSSASPAAEPPAAVTGTAAAVEAPPLPGQHPPAGERAVPADKYGAAWTAEEDAQLVAGVAERVVKGMSVNAAAVEMAAVLGRQSSAARVRVSTRLKPRIAEALALAGGRAVIAEPIPEPVATAPSPALAAPALVVAVAPPPAPRAKAARPVAPADLSGAHRRIWDWLDGIEYTADFGAADDLYMVDCFAHGTKVATLALDMGVDAKALLDRFKLVTQCIRDGKDRIQPDLQGKLGEVLRLRVKLARAAA
jgi:hypothetical protein